MKWHITSTVGVLIFHIASTVGVLITVRECAWSQRSTEPKSALGYHAHAL